MENERKDTIDDRLDAIDNNIGRLVNSLEKMIDHGDRVNNLTVETNLLKRKIGEHNHRIGSLEDHKNFAIKKFNHLQIMSVLIFVIATAGAIAQFFK